MEYSKAFDIVNHSILSQQLVIGHQRLLAIIENSYPQSNGTESSVSYCHRSKMIDAVMQYQSYGLGITVTISYYHGAATQLP